MGRLGAGLGSSGIGASLQKPLMTMLGRGACLGCLALLLTGPARSLSAQAPIAGRASGTVNLPRFTLRQILIGRNDSLVRIPGPWLRAATAGLPESLTAIAYVAAATRSGLLPLQG